MPASSEFITLCRTQVALLVDGFGASLSAVYLTEDPTAAQPTTLVPLVIFPEPSDQWPAAVPFALPSVGAYEPPVFPSVQTLEPQAVLQQLPPHKDLPQTTHPADKLALIDELKPAPMMLPLVHEGMIWGLLVVGRERRRWRKREQAQLKQIAHTLAIACVLDQRSQWLAQNHEQRLLLQGQHYTTLSTLLHQFRNPLTTLRTLGKLLLRRLNGDDANRELAQSIVGESDHLEHLLRQFDDAIDLGDASLESEEISPPSLPALLPGTNWLTGEMLTLQPCWLSEILQTALHAIAGRMDEQKMQMHLSIPDDLPPVKADATALREVFSNLIDNALKYTPAGGTIWVSLERRPTPHVYQQQVQISDTGPGIPTEDLEQIFERSYRGVQAHTDIPGTGLGLAIARDLVVQMQGELEAFSPALVPNPEPISPGSTFQVILPEYDA